MIDSRGWAASTVELMLFLFFLVRSHCLFICRPLTKRRRESNPGRLGGKRERFLFAMPSPINSILIMLLVFMVWRMIVVGVLFKSLVAMNNMGRYAHHYLNRSLLGFLMPITIEPSTWPRWVILFGADLSVCSETSDKIDFADSCLPACHRQSSESPSTSLDKTSFDSQSTCELRFLSPGTPKDLKQYDRKCFATFV